MDQTADRLAAYLYLGLHKGIPIFAKVDFEDQVWAERWRWRYKLDKRGKKYYAVRHSRRRKPDGTVVQCDVYLHKAILKERMRRRRRTRHHVIGEHGDGNSLNCRRANLSWVTRSRNCKTAKVKMIRCPKGRYVTGVPLTI